MNREGKARGIALREYTAKDVAWQYISMIWPLLNAAVSHNLNDTSHFTLEEDDLLLHYLPSSLPGGRAGGAADDSTFKKVANSLNAIGPMFGFNWRVYTRLNVRDRYAKFIYPRLTGHAYTLPNHEWREEETELLLTYAHVDQGGYLEGESPTMKDIADKITEQAAILGWNYRKYTTESVRIRLRFVRKARIAAGQPTDAYPFSSTSLAFSIPVDSDSSDMENDFFPEDEMDTAEG